jgi:SAM-dependent methyltransferase
MGKIQTFTIDSEVSKTQLCEFGHSTDKSPHNKISHFHKHPYTPIYSLLLGPYRNRPIQFCEIGIAQGYSVEMWRRYFNIESIIVAMDNSFELLARVGDRSLQNVFPLQIDVTNEEAMESRFREINFQFDIILDDSDHVFESHIKIVRTLTKFLKPGGMLIIEDVSRSNTADKYEAALGPELLEPFESVYYIKAEHANKFSGDFNNDSLLIFIKS